MCGITINNQEGNYKVEDLKLKNGQRATLVSTIHAFIFYEKKKFYLGTGTRRTKKEKLIPIRSY